MKVNFYRLMGGAGGKMAGAFLGQTTPISISVCGTKPIAGPLPAMTGTCAATNLG